AARLRPALGLLAPAGIVVPWHVAAAPRHPGFAWDYVVNQHVLFFFARKLPRDSQGDSLAFFWAAAAGRAVPWVLLVPLTLAEAVRGAARRAAPAARGTFLLWAWAGGLLLFFSCAPSRLEHYAIPALPAAALLAARAGWPRSRRSAAGPTGSWPRWRRAWCRSRRSCCAPRGWRSPSSRGGRWRACWSPRSRARWRWSSRPRRSTSRWAASPTTPR